MTIYEGLNLLERSNNRYWHYIRMNNKQLIVMKTQSTEFQCNINIHPLHIVLICNTHKKMMCFCRHKCLSKSKLSCPLTWSVSIRLNILQCPQTLNLILSHTFKNSNENNIPNPSGSLLMNLIRWSVVAKFRSLK